VSRTRETAPLALLALVAFASNSILTRMALGRGQMDAASFTAVRLAAGAVALAVLVRVQAGSWAPLGGGGRGTRGRFVGPLALFAYAAPFSFAYVRIGAAAGALLLFGAVQLTMIGWGIAAGERPRPRTWVALAVAAAGLASLTLPSVGRPDPVGSALMIVAGCAWGAYSLAGRRADNALSANARSFLWAVPLALLLVVADRVRVVSPRGVALGVASGALTSGVGYAIWYRALRGLTATQAAILQLGVPVIAAFGAVAILGESVSPRLALSGLAVIGGIALVLSERATRR
jgi:drug/metabolite transporter (DMT)-like permease